MPGDYPQLTRRLAERVMGWRCYPTSAHRKGSRPLPHCWGWRREDGEWLMVYDGAANRQWNPTEVEADAAELATKRGLVLAAGTSLPEFCASVALAVEAEQPPQEETPPDA